jgi:F-type H+-transporting ATPase subunit epsilon
MKMSLVTPNKKIHTDIEVDEVVAPGWDGQLGIYPGHAPLITTLSTGVLKFRLKGASEFHKFVVSWGYLEVSPREIIILAETAESADDLDEQRIHLAIKKSVEKLADPNVQIAMAEKYQRKLRRAQTRLELVNNK